MPVSNGYIHTLPCYCYYPAVSWSIFAAIQFYSHSTVRYLNLNVLNACPAHFVTHPMIPEFFYMMESDSIYMQWCLLYFFSQLLHTSPCICILYEQAGEKKDMTLVPCDTNIYDRLRVSPPNFCKKVMMELLWYAFIEPLLKKIVLSVEKLHTISYNVLAEKLDRLHSCEVRSTHSLSSKLLNYFVCLPFPSFISDSSLLCRQKSCTFATIILCHFNTIILWLFEHCMKNTGCLLAPFQHGSKGWGVLQTYSLLPHRKFFNKITRPLVDSKLRTCISQGLTDKINNHFLGEMANI